MKADRRWWNDGRLEREIRAIDDGPRVPMILLGEPFSMFFEPLIDPFQTRAMEAARLMVEHPYYRGEIVW